MSHTPDDFTETSLVHYSQPSYDDPRFYEPRQEDPEMAQRDSASSHTFDGPLVEQTDAITREYEGSESVEQAPSEGGEEQRLVTDQGQAKEGSSSKKKRLGGLGGLGATLIGLLIKFKTLLVVLLDIKWVAFLGKFSLASLSAIISVAIYSRLFGWEFAVGLVGLLFIHEMGHALIMKLKGIPVGGMIFIPMLGAAVFMRRVPGNARDEAEVGIAGPVAGALASLVCLLIAHAQLTASGSPGIWAPLAYFGCFLNLFNLIPIVPFDGGRVLAAIDRRIWIVGFLGLVAVQIWQWLTGTSSIWLLLFIVVAATDFWTRRHLGRTPEGRAYYVVPVGERIIIGLAYFALAAALVMGMTLAHDMMIFS